MGIEVHRQGAKVREWALGSSWLELAPPVAVGFDSLRAEWSEVVDQA